MNLLDRVITWFAPGWGQSRVLARLKARHFEAAAVGRRTENWHRLSTDANAAAGGATLSRLRGQARDLNRNNPWARRGLRRILSDTVGCGILPKASGRGADLIKERWKTWAHTLECDAAGQCTFYAMQRLILRTIAESGEVLIRRRFRRPEDGLSVPLQLQVLEPDYLDTGKDGIRLPNGGEIIQGIEIDAIGRRVAYWLFDRHPGGNQVVNPTSNRITADSILHVFDLERAGQARGYPWFASVDVRLHQFGEFEDATLDKAKIAACMAVFVTDLDGTGNGIAQPGTDRATGQPTDTFEPGMIIPLQPGRNVTVANPPAATDHQSYSATALRGIAAGIGTTYEDLTGDYSNVNYSSWRGARLAHQGDVESWQEHMLIPRFCDVAYRWFVQAMILAGENVEYQRPEWTSAPVPTLDPEKEANADKTLVRSGLKSWAKAVRERGLDPADLIAEIIAFNKECDDDGVILDSDPRNTTAAGQLQIQPPVAGEIDTGSEAGNGTDAGTSGATH